MKKIVSSTLIVSGQLIVGGLFLFMLFSDNNEDNKVVIAKNNNLNKTSDAVLELFEAEAEVTNLNLPKNDTSLVDLVSEEEKRQKEEAERIAAEQAKKEAEEKARLEAEEKARKEAEEEAARQALLAKNDVGALKEYAHNLVINSYGWTENDYNSLVSLWNRESGWNVSAANASGAYGIPQALPASKMSKYGDDYLTNGQTQIMWGLDYIKSRYGSPDAAWNYFLSHNHY